jgi:hypothetical protein
MISGTRVGAVSVGTTSDGRVWLTAQDALQFACGGASDARAKQKLGGLMRSSLRPRVMCGIRDSSHKHMHTQYTHTQTHTRTRTHTHTHKYTHTHTPTPVARSCVCVAMSSLSLSKSLCISLSLGVPACVSGGSDALLAGADENSWQSRPRHACASSAFHTPSSRLHAPCAIQQQATVMVLLDASAIARNSKHCVLAIANTACSHSDLGCANYGAEAQRSRHPRRPLPA